MVKEKRSARLRFSGEEAFEHGEFSNRASFLWWGIKLT